jgi:hypothetical protein
MEEERRNFYAAVVQQSKQLSKCTSPKAALIVRGESLCGLGTNKILATGGKIKTDIETSPVFEALATSGIFGRDFGQTGSGDGCDNTGRTSNREIRSAFLTYFPHVGELVLLYQSGVQVIYFFGDLDDEDSVNLLNSLTYKQGQDMFGTPVEYPFFTLVQLTT